MYALHNPDPAIPLVKILNGQKKELRNLAEIFGKFIQPAVPPRVPVTEVVQKILKEMNQEGDQIKSAYQSKSFNNEEPLKFPIV